ncbi:hypothetical protein DsansV1_C05g0052521 [Dioscorea sansibarensis]
MNVVLAAMTVWRTYFIIFAVIFSAEKLLATISTDLQNQQIKDGSKDFFFFF